MNTVADALSRWAYPATKRMQDVSAHGSLADAEAVKDMKAEELRHVQIIGVQRRHGVIGNINMDKCLPSPPAVMPHSRPGDRCGGHVRSAGMPLKRLGAGCDFHGQGKCDVSHPHFEVLDHGAQSADVRFSHFSHAEHSDRPDNPKCVAVVTRGQQQGVPAPQGPPSVAVQPEAVAAGPATSSTTSPTAVLQL